MTTLLITSQIVAVLRVLASWSECVLTRWRERLTAGVQLFENFLLALTLGAMVLVGAVLALPPAMQQTIGLPGGEEVVRHLTLLIGMLGGMVAARERRLLAITGLAQVLPLPWQPWLRAFTAAVSTAVSTLLVVAGIELVSADWSSSRTLAVGISIAVMEAALPVGFAVIALRCFWQAGGWSARLGAAAITALSAFLLLLSPVDPQLLRWPALALIGLATLLGAPVFVGLAGSALILFASQNDPIASIPLDHYDQVTNPLLATLPLFTLTGYILAESGASRRLLRFFLAWTGHLRGGPAIVAVLGCAFFTAFTGGSGVTILALGGLLMPLLAAARYSERASLGLITGAGSLGVLLPPCLPLILYSIVAQVSMEEMFLAGIVPGLMLMLLTGWWGARVAPRRNVRNRIDLREALAATCEARYELLLPAIPLVLIFGGLALPVPAAAITALYAFVVEGFVHRDLPLGRRLIGLGTECGLLIGGVLLILGTAMGFTNFLITEHVPDRLAGAISSLIDEPWMFLLALNLFLLAVGCLMDIFSAIIVIAPLILPAAAVLGIDPVHLGIVFLANLELGYLTPPVGLNLLLSASRFERPMLTVTRAALPMLAVLSVGVLLITYLPALSTWLPQVLAGPE